MWPRRCNPLIEEERLRKMAASQQTLFDAVSATTSMAEDVTACLSGAVRARSRDNGIDMLVVVDPRQRIVYANDTFLNRYHVTREAIGRDMASILTALNPTTLTGQAPTRRSQVRVTGRDGRVRIEDWIEHAVFDGATLVEYQCTGRDITSSVVVFAKPRLAAE